MANAIMPHELEKHTPLWSGVRRDICPIASSVAQSSFHALKGMLIPDCL